MTGWLLIIALLLLGGVLSTFGDRLGSKVGKARLSIFNLRPRTTAVLITVLTGSFISALSLGFLLLVSRQLRVGLFALDDLQTKLRVSRLALAPLQKESKRLESIISSREKELKKLERNFIALRRGDVVISSGQLLSNKILKFESKEKVKREINQLLQKANLEAYRRVLPGETPNKQILLVTRSDINRLEEIIVKKGTWVVNFRSATNVLLGEKLVYAFPEVRPNITIVRKGEVISRISLQPNELDFDSISKRMKLLLASTFAEVKRRGSVISGLDFDAAAINRLGKSLINRKVGNIELESVSFRTSETSDRVYVGIRLTGDLKRQRRKINRL